MQTLSDALRVVEALEIGQTVRLAIRRDGLAVDLTAEIEERPHIKAIFGSTVWIDPQGAPAM